MRADNSTGNLDVWTVVPILVCFVLLAGCSGGGSTSTPTAAATTDTPTTAPTETVATETTTERRTTRRTTTTKAVDNPWGKTPIVVGIRNDGDARNYTPQVRAAVKYWKTNGSEYATWEPALVVRPNASDPDVVVRFKKAVTLCGFTVEPGASYLGCASILEPDTRPQSPETVAIRSGMTNDSTYRTVRHEFGHILGLDHGEPPVEVMNESDVVTQQVYSIFVDTSRISLRGDTTIRQTEHVMQYYDDGAEGWLEEDVTFELV